MVERNVLLECDRAIALGLSSPDANSRDGETVYDHQGGVIRNNFVHRGAGAATGDVGITVNHARNYRILHNTVVLNGTFPWAIEYRFPASDGVVAGNLADGVVLRRDGASGQLADNIETALPAWFRDEPAGDLHLAAAATPAIDAAPARPEVSDDVDASPRPLGGAAEIGADELCAVPASAIAAVVAVRQGADVALAWAPAAAADSYQVWSVGRKQDIDLARATSSPPAVPIAGCSPPSPAPGASCIDTDAIARPGALHYQVRGACEGAEGP